MLDPFLLPTKRPTPTEYGVIAILFSVIFIILGIIALVVAFRAPPEKHELAVALAHRGFWSIGIGVAIGVGYWLIRRLKDSV
jgi:L-asparagine transporter-like permease